MSNNRTEPPTPKKMQDARKKGQVPKSEDFTASGVFLLGAVFLSLSVSGTFQKLQSLLLNSIELAVKSPEISNPSIVIFTVTKEAIQSIMETSIGVLIFVAGTALLLNFLHIGPVFKQLKPDVNSINPLKGLKSMFSGEKVWESVKTGLKLAVTITISGYIFIQGISATLAASGYLTPASIGDVTADYAARIAWNCGVFFVFIGGMDLFYKRLKWKKDLMMTKEEVKREFKESEGDPHIKNLRQQNRLEMMTYQRADEIRRSAVVVTNPVRLAIALKFDAHHNSAPIISAKGRYKAAENIKKIARESGIPIIRRPNLARDLYSNKEGDEIPESLYEIVAELLVFLNQLTEAEKQAFR